MPDCYAFMRFACTSFLTLGGLLMLSSCREAKIESYRVPKEAAPPAPLTQPSGSTMASSPVPTATGTDLTWNAPTNWIVQGAAPMRKAGYTITTTDGGTAELTVTAFPGDVGGDLANVNRWRNQLQQPPLSTDALPAAIQSFTSNQLAFKLTEINTGTQSTLAAWVMHDGSSWFFKLTGSSALVAHERPAFLAFLKTIKAE